jgi:hypothetical protein
MMKPPTFEDRVRSLIKYAPEWAYLGSEHFKDLEEYERALNIANRELFRRGWEIAKVEPIEGNKMIASWALDTRPVYMRSRMSFTDPPERPKIIHLDKA